MEYFDPEHLYPGDLVASNYAGNILGRIVCRRPDWGSWFEPVYVIQCLHADSTTNYSYRAIVPVEDMFVRYARWVRSRNG